jgi:hypothetical protein
MLLLYPEIRAPPSGDYPNLSARANDKNRGNRYNEDMKTQTIFLLTFILLLTSCGPAALPASTVAGAAIEKPTRTPKQFNTHSLRLP